MWSVGVLMYVLLCGAMPFSGETDDEIKSSIISGAIDFENE